MPWVYDPHSGGIKIPARRHYDVFLQVENYACTRPWYPTVKLKARIKNQFCYVDMLQEGDDRPFPLCRLRFFRENIWSFALFTYSNESYKPCAFSDGKLEGSLEDALLICEPFIAEL